MPHYQLRFRVETCLKRETNLVIEHAGEKALFLFAAQVPSDNQVIAQVELEAPKYDDAWGIAASIVLPRILDALSFATGTPLLLRDLELVLKQEMGEQQRRALFVGNIRLPWAVPLGELEIMEVERILACGDNLRLPVCWHRYALDRELALEQFVFHWLSFEALAGDTIIPSRCPKCAQELNHCGLPVNHRGQARPKRVRSSKLPTRRPRIRNSIPTFGARLGTMYSMEGAIPSRNISRMRSHKEALPLRWDAIDFVNDVIRVRESKTGAGIRNLPLSTRCKQELLRWRERFGPAFSDFVFPSLQTPQKPMNDIRGAWAKTLVAAGLPYFVLYNLRHSFASRLSAAGVSDLFVAQMIGHSGPGILQRYSKAIDEYRRDALRKLETPRMMSDAVGADDHTTSVN